MQPLPKTYEDVFSSERSQKSIRLDKIKLKGFEVGSYIDFFSEYLKTSMNDIFDIFVRIIWLQRKFSYNGKSKKKRASGIVTDRAYSVFMRRFLNKDIRIFTRNFIYSKIETYIDELFPSFMDGNPFENPDSYKFPFSFISIDYMTVVYQIPERMELLKYADDKRMPYNEFLDFVINHIYTINEEQKKDKYSFILSSRCAPYVKNNERKI